MGFYDYTYNGKTFKNRKEAKSAVGTNWKDVTSSVSKTGKTISSIGNAVSSITGAMSNLNGSISAEAGAAREGMRSAIGQFGPWGAVISAASGIVDSITDATGISWNTIDKADASRAGVGKGITTANNILASIPGNSIWGAVLGKTNQAQKSVYIDQMANSYGGSVQDINSAMNLSGKRAFGRRTMNSFIDEQNRVNNLITNIAMQSELAKNNNAAELYQQQNFNKYSGYTPQLLLAKKGSKIPELEVAKNLISKWTPKQKTAVDLNSLMYDISTLFNGKDAATNVSSSVMQFLSDIQNGIDEKDISTLVTNSLADASKNTDSIGIKVVNTISNNKDKLIDLFNQHGYNTEVFNDINNLQSIRYIGKCLSELLGTRSFKSGNKINLDEVRNYYKDYDLSNVEFITDESPRTEGNKLYIRNDEDAVHELWHYLSQNRPNEIYKEYYDNLNDNRIVELGGDLQFVTRIENDPGHFYHPSELEARIKAAKFKTKGQNYTKEFFQNLRKEENKYGNNMRDLLHMYNDDNLVKIFSLKKGGSIRNTDIPEIEETTQKNIIPEGALHKNKHHLEEINPELEGTITEKGIPVITEDGEQKAEIEKEEIVFKKSTTEQLEEYYDQYNNSKDDSIAIECGKFLVEEILKRTEDRTGLLKTVSDE